MTESTGPRVEVDRPRCPYCHEPVEGAVAKTACGTCMAWHHRTCWSEHGVCSACGARDAAGAGPAPSRPAPDTPLTSYPVAPADQPPGGIGGPVLLMIAVVAAGYGLARFLGYL